MCTFFERKFREKYKGDIDVLPNITIFKGKKHVLHVHGYFFSKQARTVLDSKTDNRNVH